MNTRRIIGILSITCICAAALPMGCQTVKEGDADSAKKKAWRRTPAGVVEQVNTDYQYVILRCESLPSEGQEVTLYRDGKPVGRVKVTGPHRPPFVAADIVDGEPKTGDTVGE